MKEKSEVVFVNKRHIGIIAKYKTGWRKELNLISWNDGTPKYDIRDWDEKHNHMSRGITLHPDEAKVLAKLLSSEKFE
ncbi:MAG: PC4/YdbC family ssDNA-binding protein [Anaerovoracaceae bacterium]